MGRDIDESDQRIETKGQRSRIEIMSFTDTPDQSQCFLAFLHSIFARPFLYHADSGS